MITAKGQGRTPGEARAPNRAKALLHAQVPVHCCWSGPLGGCSPLATSKAGLLAFKTLPWTSLLLAVQSRGGKEHGDSHSRLTASGCVKPQVYSRPDGRGLGLGPTPAAGG